MRLMQNSGIEWIGEIPKEWTINSISQLFSQVKNKNTDLQETNLLSLSYGKIKRKNIETTDGLLPESFDGYNIVESNDIVLRLTDLQNDHKSLRVGLVTERGIITSAYLTIRNHSESIAKYLYFYLHAFDISKGFYGMGAGVRQGLNWDGIKWLKMLSPSIPEQQAIADFLDSQCVHIDSVIEKTCAAVEEYKKLKQAVITQAVTKGIRPNREMKDSGIEWIGEIPREWRMTKIKVGVSKVGSGKTPSGGAEVYADEGIIFLRSQNIYDTGIVIDSPTFITNETDEEMKNTRVQPNDVLLNITGGSIGRCCIFPNYLKQANVNQHVSIVRVIKTIILSEFMHLYWISDLGKMSIQLFQTGGNREGMTADAIKNSPIAIPDLPEQSEIVAYLDEKTAAIDSLIQKKEQLITELEAYKKSLIYEYVTGKKEVPVHAH
ncbi:restriction endonuclease subunit S [Ruminococcus sp.]|uniref:restriction endonuclease subunit S n=1 Tax=Ruminococcus sp. TaxID=41978 RepID=UPI002E76D756|nr:restriction endonuclease subunit S [Ruminococcus sp.]MEE1261408.1 restriction endonuclease subunit S [Ruminococcus sp.]